MIIIGKVIDFLRKNIRFSLELSDPLFVLITQDFTNFLIREDIFNIHLQPFYVLWGHEISFYYFPFSTHRFFKPGKMNKVIFDWNIQNGKT